MSEKVLVVTTPPLVQLGIESEMTISGIAHRIFFFFFTCFKYRICIANIGLNFTQYWIGQKTNTRLLLSFVGTADHS